MHNEKLISITEAAKACPSRPSPNAVWRWMRKGIQARSGERVRLGHQRLGGKLFTSHEAIERFGNRLAEADASYFAEPDTGPAQPKPTRSDSQRERDVARAEAELEQAGI